MNYLVKPMSSKLIDTYTQLNLKKTIETLSFNEHLDLANELIQQLKGNDDYLYRREVDSITLSKRSGIGIPSPSSFINLASNDYLNFTRHPEIIKASINVIQTHGVGSGSVPMLAGTCSIHKDLELQLADFIGYEKSITFNSGYAANYGLLTALLTSSDIAILDTYVHASIIDGCKHSNIGYFKHNDIESLKHVLKKNKNFQNKLVIVDGVYSMDGDIAKLDQIISIAKENNAWIMIDESHALGVIGPQGRGTQEHLQIKHKADIVTGSLGKALGGSGGFVAGTEKMINFLEINSRPFIYSTSITPNSAASLIKALELLRNNDPALQVLWKNINYFKERLHNTGFRSANTESSIFPLIIQNVDQLLDLCKKLQDDTIFVNPVFYPVVPKKKSRMRLSITATLSREDLDHTLERLEYYGKYLNLTDKVL